MSKSLAGQVAAVTGGARGIGRAIAEALISQGCSVGIGDVDLDEAKRTAEELGPRCEAFELDVTDRASFTRFLDDTEAALGPLEILVNNAGIMLVGQFEKEEEAATDAMIDINLKGVLSGCQLAVPRMRDRSSGHLVNIASSAGKIGVANLVTYCATKHAVVGLSDALREELRGTGVHVSTVMPTVVDTRLGAGAGKTIAPVLQPSDVADVVVHLLQTRKNEATVPRWGAGVAAPLQLLPSKAKQAVLRRIGADSMTKADHTQRTEYESGYRGRR